MRRSGLLAGLSGCIVIVLVLTGQRLDLPSSLDLLSGRSITAQTELALVAMLCWVAAAALAAAAGLAAVRAQGGARTVFARRWPVVVLAIGVALLAAGAERSGGYRVCCATPTSAQEAEQLVR